MAAGDSRISSAGFQLLLLFLLASAGVSDVSVASSSYYFAVAPAAKTVGSGVAAVDRRHRAMLGSMLAPPSTTVDQH